MAPLKYLERDYPAIDSNFQQFCASHGVFSVEDFLLQDHYALVAFAEQQSTSVRLKQGITQLLSVVGVQHQPWLNGMELFEDAQRNKHVLSTGCEGIDFLQGGLRKGQITELVGPSSSGKTQVCLQAASNVAKKYTCNIIYLDTGNAFSAQRVAHFVDQILNPALKEAKHKIIQEVMDRILCHSVFDMYAMLDVLHQLESNLRSQICTVNGQVQLIIVDSMSSLIAPILGCRGASGHALMISAGFLLKKLAYEYNLAVLVTNHMVGGEGGTLKPALGESWKSIPHVRLLLSRDHGSNICNMSILHHPSTVSGKGARFMIPN